MRTILSTAALTVLAVSLGGCVGHTDAPYPVSSNVPNPAPAPGYRVLCQSTPTPVISFFDRNHRTGCQQVIPPVTDEVVVRARG